MINKVIKEEEADRVPLVPPGYESLTSFTLRRIRGNSVPMDCVAGSSTSSLMIGNNERCIIDSDSSKMARILRRKPWVNYNEFEDRSDIEINSKGHENVPAKWHPAEAHRPLISEAPAFYPTEEEFKDTLKYIASIRSRAEPYGICRIVPPPSWKPSCPLKEKQIWENSKFPTRVQRIDKLQNRISSRKNFSNQQKMLRQRRKPKMTIDGDSAILYGADDNKSENRNLTEGFGFEPGLEFTLASFEKYAIDFKEQYFCTKEFSQPAAHGNFHCQKQWEPSIEDIEGEYWRIVENTSEKIEVLYGADIETHAFGSGFPKVAALGTSGDEYAQCGWNLNNVSRLPGSMLSYESGDISGVLVPWLYVGMCFSSFCWHVEDHHLYSLNYMHWGAQKIWYGVAGKNALMLEEAMKKHLRDLFDEQPDLLHKLVTQLSPNILKSEGVPVYRCVQNPGEFVLTFPRAYHSGFNCGFNCAEAVNVAPIDWLPHGQNAVECYREQGRKISVSHDKLLLGGASEAVKALYELLFLNKSSPENLRWKGVCGKDGILSKALKARVDMEQERRESLCNSLRTRKMEKDFDADTEKECVVCCYDLHFSAAGCDCSSDRFVCLMHAKSLCACDWNSRFFIFRYDLSDLLVLLEALEGKLSAVHKWAKSDLGLSLSSFVCKRGVSYLSTCSAAAGHNNSAMATSVSRKDNDQKVVGGTFPDGNIYVSTVSHLNKESHVAESKHGGCYSSNEKMLVHSGDSNGHLEDLQKLNAGIEYLASKEVRHFDSKVTRFSTSQDFQKNHQNRDQFSCSLNANGHTSVEKTRLPISRSSVTHEISNSSSSNGSHNILDRINRNSSLPEVAHISSGFAQKDMNTALNVSCKTPDSSEYTASGVKRKINEIVPDVPVHVEKKICVVNPHSVKDKQNGFLGPSNKHFSTSEVVHISTGLPQKDMNTASTVSCKSPDSSKNTASGMKRKIIEIAPDAEAHVEKKNCAVKPHCVKGKHNGFLGPPISHLQTTQACPSEHLRCGAKNESSEGYVGSGSDEKLATDNGTLSQSQNSLHRLNRHKGPRIAKVVRRVNCKAELLEVGAVMPGKLWSNDRAIFLNGFRSRVKYYSIFDPTKMCYYVSEVLESSQLGPLFKVTVEECSTEVFIHLTAVQCWDMVRERVNMEIRKQHAVGKVGLPPLQPPTSVDGLEMFGFSLSTVIMAIEAKDPDHLCVEYWSSKADNKQQAPNLTGCCTLDSKPDANLCTNKELHENKTTPGEVGKVLKGLLRKANTAELVALRSLLTDKKENHSFEIVTRLIAEEFLTRPNVYSK